jgi:riboflavin synthase
VSLTLAGVDVAGQTFEVALIPTTLELTTLGDLKAGDAVNLEVDVLVKAVVNYLEHHAGQTTGTGSGPRGVTMELLKKAGFGE